MANKPTLSGPGRGTPRTRTAARPGSRGASRSSRRGTARTTIASRLPQGSSGIPRMVRNVGITRRAIALLLVIAVLMISVASSLRVYFRQERELATAQQQIAQRTAENAALTDEVNRWNDPNFVKAQARQRLGWVVPGETGYRVVDADGKPLDGGITITSTSSLPAGEHAPQWWDRLGGSLAAADAPLVAPDDQSVPTVSETPAPTPTPTPTKKR